MHVKKIKFILIYIDEAHSNKWPIGLEVHPAPHTHIANRVARAQDFVQHHKTVLDSRVFSVFVDTWSNTFADTFRAWPDAYYHLDKDYTVLTKSEYGQKADALINVDCLDLVHALLEET